MQSQRSGMEKKKRDWIVDLGNGYWYDSEPDFYNINVDSVEMRHDCRYVCEWPTIDKQGEISSHPSMIFWNDTAHPQGSNWMALFKSNSEWYVKDGITASLLPICCIISKDREVLFSKHEHDYRTSKDGSITVDGGREYVRIIRHEMWPIEEVWLLPQQGRLTIIDKSAAQLLLSGIKDTHRSLTA